MLILPNSVIQITPFKRSVNYLLITKFILNIITYIYNCNLLPFRIIPICLNLNYADILSKLINIFTIRASINIVFEEFDE